MVVGLGNPGPDYQETRHNAGFWFLDRWAGIQELSFRKAWFRPYLFCHRLIGRDTLVLVKPLTNVNRSGTIFGTLLTAFKAVPDDLLVVFDQMDLAPGRVRMKPHGSTAGHNGLRSIDAALGGDRYHRLAIGVGRPVLAGGVIDHVLGTLPAGQRLAVDAAVEKAALRADAQWREGWEALIHAVNQRDPEISQDA